MRLDYIRFRQKAKSRFFMADGRFRAEADHEDRQRVDPTKMTQSGQ
jgi:hypothetical protein